MEFKPEHRILLLALKFTQNIREKRSYSLTHPYPFFLKSSNSVLEVFVQVGDLKSPSQFPGEPPL